MQNSAWLAQYLEKVSRACEEGRSAVEYIRAHKTKVGFKRARKSVGAFWTPAGNIQLNSARFSPESGLSDPRTWTLLIHEVCHLRQGWLTALSVYGELEAWQLGFRAHKKITGLPLFPILEELLSLPLDGNRANLQRARKLMQSYAGKGYRVDLLPLYPLHKEIMFLFTRRTFE